MIESLSVAVPVTPVDRSGYDKAQLADFERVTGILHTRRWGGTTADLACRAVDGLPLKWVRKARNIIVVTQSPDRLSPCTAMEVAREFGISGNVPVMDVNESCSGFIYGLWLMRNLTPVGERSLLVCVDRLRAKPGLESLIFSDCAVAAVYFASQFTENQPTEFLFHTDGEGAKKLCSDEDGLLCMDGGAVFDFVTKNVPPMIKEYSKLYPCELLVQHQPNKSMMRLVASRAGFSGAGPVVIEEFGNMSMCSVPTAIAAREADCLGKHLLLCGYGAGWSVGMTSVKWPKEPICSMRWV